MEANAKTRLCGICLIFSSFPFFSPPSHIFPARFTHIIALPTHPSHNAFFVFFFLQVGVLNKVFLEFPKVFWEDDVEVLNYVAKVRPTPDSRLLRLVSLVAFDTYLTRYLRPHLNPHWTAIQRRPQAQGHVAGELQPPLLHQATHFVHVCRGGVRRADGSMDGRTSRRLRVEGETATAALRTAHCALRAACRTAWLLTRCLLSAVEQVLREIEDKVPAPTRHVVTRWHADPFARGSYSYSGVGAVQPHDRRAIAAPVGNRLFFAGEHTSVLYPATAHGAYLSGVEAARALVLASPSR